MYLCFCRYNRSDNGWGLVMAVVRILFGLVVACLTAALIKIAHVITPLELSGLAGDALVTRLTWFGELVLLTATHQALFTVPFALIAITVAEINRWRGWLTYALLGSIIALGGFYLQYTGEGELRTIANPYAGQAFAIEGLCAGLVYWLLAGRFAGWRRGGAVVRARPYPVSKPRLQVSDVGDAPHTTGKPVGNGAKS
jgi:hypothetical protein